MASRTVALVLVVLVTISASKGCQALLLPRPTIAGHSFRPAAATARATAKAAAKVGAMPHHSSRRTTSQSVSLLADSAMPCHLSRRSTCASMLADATTEPVSVLAGCKLIYFGIPGRGEAVRLALTIGGIKFEDKRVPFPAWGKVKPTTPWGTLPVLELADGSQLAQARSILRFVGKSTGLYPSDPLIAQRVDELMDALEDLDASITNTGRGLPKDEQEAARLAAVSEGGAVYCLLEKIDAFIQAHGSGGYAVDAVMNIASILTFTTLGRVVGGVFYGVPPTVCDAFPNIQAVRKTVGNDPATIAWYDARVVQQKSLKSISPAEQVLVGCRDL